MTCQLHYFVGSIVGTTNSSPLSIAFSFLTVSFGEKSPEACRCAKRWSPRGALLTTKWQTSLCGILPPRQSLVTGTLVTAHACCEHD